MLLKSYEFKFNAQHKVLYLPKKNEITKGAQLNRNFGSKVVRFFATLKKIFSGTAKNRPLHSIFQSFKNCKYAK